MSKKKKAKLQEMQTKASSMAWLTTFADLMSLLMAFFVILFALSEVDKEKFKMLGYSLKQAFGVPVPSQLQSNAKTEITDPSTSKDKKSAPEDVFQKVKKRTKERAPISPDKNPEPIRGGQVKTKAKTPITKNASAKSKQNAQNKAMQQAAADKQKRIAKTKRDADALKQIFKDEINRKMVSIDQKGEKIIIRLTGAGAFHSGSADLTTQIQSALDKFSDSLRYIKGNITVSGHTDDRPINTPLFRSNWELSAARASSIINVLVKREGVNASRISLRAHADTKGLVPNDSEKNRAKNRRIEIMIDQAKTKSEPATQASAASPSSTSSPTPAEPTAKADNNEPNYKAGPPPLTIKRLPPEPKPEPDAAKN